MESNVMKTVNKALNEKKGDIAKKMVKMTKIPVRDDNMKRLPVKDLSKKK